MPSRRKTLPYEEPIVTFAAYTQRSRIRAERLKHVPTLLLGGRDQRAEGNEGIGTLLRSEAAGDLLLDLHHPPVLFRLVVGEGNVGIGEEAEYVFLAGAQAQQEVVTGTPPLTASALALALASPLERGLGLMPLYYLPIKDGDELLVDPEGSRLPNLQAARTEAIESARQLISEAVLSGSPLRMQRAFQIDDVYAINSGDKL
jgi:hypothetical protein